MITIHFPLLNLFGDKDMYKLTAIVFLFTFAFHAVTAQMSDTSISRSNQVADTIRPVSPPHTEPTGFGTMTEIKKINDYNAADIVKELKKGKFGHPVDIEKDSLHWKTGGIFSAAISQGSRQNWAAGGDRSSLTLDTRGNLFANYADKRNNWDNNIDIAFGYLNTSGLGTQKSDDRINIYSKYGYRFSKRWFYSAMISFRSQFANGYNYPDDSAIVSHFLAPAYVLASLGFNYKPADYFSVFMSPLTSRFVIVNSQGLADLGSFGVDSARYFYHDSTRTLISHGRKMRYELGPFVSFQFNKDILQNVNWTSRLDLYSNYLHNPQNIDIYWSSLVTFRVNKFMTASLDTELIYDDDVKFITYAKNSDGSIKTDPDTGEQMILRRGPRLQFKELIGIGVAWQF